jgi:hypothetical protein
MGNIKEITEEDLNRMEREHNKKAKEDLFHALVDMDRTSGEEISLKRLIAMPYKVTDEDEDVMLNNQMFVKILKIMLYKLGLVSKREDYFKRELLQTVDERLDQHKHLVKSSFKEVNEFIQGFHSDFIEQMTGLRKDRQD